MCYRNLDCYMADSASAALHQHTLAGLDTGSIYHAFPGGQKYQRNCRGFAHGEILRFQCQKCCVDRSIFGQRALQPPNASG
ncbi:hypothetical protein D3C81_1612520 [compost metagenome]